MSSKDTESQFQFLISCIKHSTSGKVDFAEVAEDCNIVSKGAAAKRYERLMKAHGITGNGGGGGGSSSKTPVKKEKAENEGKTPKSRPSKKRKLEQVDEDAGDIDEPAVKGEVKSEIKSEVKREDGMTVKSEPADVFTTPSTSRPVVDNDGGGGDDDDDDDDVFVVSSTDNRDGSVHHAAGGVGGGGRGRSSNSHPHHHHHHHQHVPSLAAHAHHAHHHHAMPHFHNPMNHVADLNFHQQALPTTAPTATTSVPRVRVASSPVPGDVLPYGFPASRNFPHNHDTSGFH